ncbi:MAG: alpha-L-fucosidase [Prevotella sp.]|jgi:alpha-L-fucosidase|nr:alpha-L-fucosidase [Prevotella sp.]
MKTNLKVILLLFFVVSLFSLAQNNPIKPYGALPTKDQVEWQQLEYYMFIHFGPNTFTNVEWGNGKENPKVFNPSDLDCRQWAATAKAAGMKGIIITAKHHDGFCLWPSKYSTHTVRESPWKDGKGDVLRELSDACREYDLKFGVYLSPWDQNHPAYGTPQYNEIFSNTLDEVLSSYGEVFEQWFDGANGEGHEGKKQVYDWDMFHKTVYRNQPHAVIFSDIGPGCRWMGNERGVAGKTNWSTLNITGFGPGRDAPASEILNTGQQGGEAWVPAETDVSIRPGWFYSPDTDDKVKSVEKLMDIYYTSVGRNSNLLLNVPPDRRGRIHATDSVRLMEFRRAREEAFADNLAIKASLKVSSTRKDTTTTWNKSEAYNILDDSYNTYWTPNENELNPSIEIDLKKIQTFNRLLLQEYIPLGQRVKSFTVKYWDAKKKTWVNLAEETTIGYKRILRFPSVATQKLKIEFNTLACPVISTVAVYDAPELSVAEKVVDDKDRIDVKNWKLLSPQSLESSIVNENDNRYLKIDKATSLIVDLGKAFKFSGFSYTPVAKEQSSNILKYNFYISPDGTKWIKIKDNQIFNNVANNPIKQRVKLTENVEARYIKLEVLETADFGNHYFVAGLDIYK